MKFLKSKLPAVIVLSAIFVLFIGTLIIAWSFSKSLDIYWSPTTIISGEYSIDDGPWVETDLTQPINDRFHKIIFRGRLILMSSFLSEINISFKKKSLLAQWC